MKTATFYVLRINGLFIGTIEDTMLSTGEGTLAEARRFPTLGELLDWAQRRGKRHASATSLANFEIVKVSESITTTTTVTEVLL